MSVAALTAVVGYHPSLTGTAEGLRSCVEYMADVERDWEIARNTTGPDLKAGFDKMVTTLNNISKRAGCSEFAPNLLP